MGLWARTGRFWKAVALLAVGLAGGGAALAVASVPDSNGVIHACYSVDASGNPVTSAANLTVIDPSAGQVCSTTVSPTGGPPAQKALEWNVQGVPGAKGDQGPPGQPAPPGAGNTFTVSNGTLLLAGGQLLSVESAGGGVNLPTPPNGGAGGDSVVLGSGRGALTFPFESVALLGSQAAGTSGVAGKAAHNDISVTKTVDAASPKLYADCASGQHFPAATITVRKKGGSQYLRYTLSQVYVLGVQTFVAHNNGSPAETVTFTFASLGVQYVSQSSHHGPAQVKSKVHIP